MDFQFFPCLLIHHSIKLSKTKRKNSLKNLFLIQCTFAILFIVFFSAKTFPSILGVDQVQQYANKISLFLLISISLIHPDVHAYQMKISARQSCFCSSIFFCFGICMHSQYSSQSSIFLTQSSQQQTTLCHFLSVNQEKTENMGQKGKSNIFIRNPVIVG